MSKSMVFANDCLTIAEKIERDYQLSEQLASASASIPQNLSEGYGSWEIAFKQSIF